MFVRVLVFTLVEDAALIAWLALVRAGRALLGGALLPIGFFVEHVIADNVKNHDSLFNLRGIPYGRIAVNALLETGLWLVWLFLWPFYQFDIFGVGIPAFAIVWLQITLHIEHNLTDNIFHGRPLFADLFNSRVLGFTTLENIGASGWLGLIGAGQPIFAIMWLIVFQQAEHMRAIVLGQRPR